jgi:SAM-dependent methyltransferase
MKPAAKRGARRGGKDLELVAGTVAHYEDPSYYTHTYARRLEDVRYYVDLARDRVGPKGSVLEYGCGNGRIAIPMARLGVAVTGVDLSSDMLADFRARLANEDATTRSRIALRRGDMRNVSIGRRFELVLCPFNAFLHLYTREDVERFLARAKAHLAPGGELVFDVSIPEPLELARDPARAYHAPRFRHPTAGDVVRYTERFDYDKQRQILFVAMEFSPLGGGDSWMTPLAHRQFYPQELEALLHYNGFEVARWFGDFSGNPVERESSTLVVHARARRARAR